MPSAPLLQGEAFRDPRNTGPRKTHEMPVGGLFSVYDQIIINAPAQIVLDAVLNVGEYKNWNTFVPKVVITKHPNSHDANLRMKESTFMDFHVKMTDDYQTISKTVCMHIGSLRTRATHSKNFVTSIRWKLDNANSFLPGFVLKAERVHEFEENEDGTTTYRTWESFAGLGAYRVRSKYLGVLQDRFRDWCEDLKKFTEENNGTSVSTNQ